MLKAAYIMNPLEWGRIYPPPVHAEIAEMVQFVAPVLTPAQALCRPDLLGQVDILFSGWGGPKLSEQFLDLAPHLKAVFYGAGSADHMLTEASFNRKIEITTAIAINAIPVAEFSLAHILLGLKRTWQHAREVKERRAFIPQLPVAGVYQSTVGLISLGTIGRQVRKRLESFEVNILAYDPTLTDKDGLSLQVEMTSLNEVFARSDVVSLHSPLIPQTKGMITGAHLAMMKEGATFINTSRGAIVRESEMIEVLRTRTDLTAILDVTDPEPPRPDCQLFDLPNAILTPHIAGSLDGECGRMGRLMAHEIKRYLAGHPLAGRILPSKPLPTAPVQPLHSLDLVPI